MFTKATFTETPLSFDPRSVLILTIGYDNFLASCFTRNGHRLQVIRSSPIIQQIESAIRNNYDHTILLALFSVRQSVFIDKLNCEVKAHIPDGHAVSITRGFSCLSAYLKTIFPQRTILLESVLLADTCSLLFNSEWRPGITFSALVSAFASVAQRDPERIRIQQYISLCDENKLILAWFQMHYFAAKYSSHRITYCIMDDNAELKKGMTQKWGTHSERLPSKNFSVIFHNSKGIIEPMVIRSHHTTTANFAQLYLDFMGTLYGEKAALSDSIERAIKPRDIVTRFEDFLNFLNQAAPLTNERSPLLIEEPRSDRQKSISCCSIL